MDAVYMYEFSCGPKLVTMCARASKNSPVPRICNKHALLPINFYDIGIKILKFKPHDLGLLARL